MDNTNSYYNKLCDLIKNNINGRKLAVRWKSPAFEKALSDAGLKPDIYLTRALDRINDTDTFSDTVIFGKSDEYYLIVTEELAWNKGDSDRYLKAGYKNIQDMLWVSHEPKTISLGNGVTHYEDEYGNVIDSDSNVSITLTGNNNKIRIGKNVHMPKKAFKMGKNNIMEIGDNSNLENATLVFGTGSKFIVGQNVNFRTMTISLQHNLNELEIGDGCGLRSGLIGVGRNQKVRIGKGCMFSWSVTILSHDMHLIYDLNKEKFINNTNGEQQESIVIGDHVWIGAEAVIMPNTHIGTGSICGFRCMAKGRYPNNCILAGMPAKVIRKDIAWTTKEFAQDDNEILELPEEYRKMTEEATE